MGGAGWWAGRATLEAPESPLDSTPVPTYEVSGGRVGQTQNVFVNASWSLTEAARNQLPGIVTSVEHQDGEGKAGQVLFRVSLEPVVVAIGDVPAFREMSTGTKGPDVRQLQRMLGSLGLYRGSADGSFDEGVADAVTRWQSTLNSDETGIVKFGQVLFVPDLPARLVLGTEVQTGQVLRGGEVAVQQVAEAPSFAVALLPEQQRFAVAGIDVMIEAEGSDAEWNGTVVSVDPGLNGGFELQVAGIEGEPVCGDLCEAIPLGEPTILRGQLVLVAPLEGPVLPVGAMLTSPEGDVHVVMADGSQRRIRILASSDGLAVVDGVAVGEIVRLGGSVE